MTIGEIIKEHVDAMPPGKQRKALTLVKRLEAPIHRKRARTKPVRKNSENYVPKDPALRAIAGMWKDRTDLPKDPVQAVKAIRARMWSRGSNG